MEWRGEVFVPRRGEGFAPRRDEGFAARKDTIPHKAPAAGRGMSTLQSTPINPCTIIGKGNCTMLESPIVMFDRDSTSFVHNLMSQEFDTSACAGTRNLYRGF